MARFKALKTIGASTTELTKMQSNVSSFIEQFADAQILDGVLIRNIELVSGSVNKVKHKLGRKLIGWIVVRKNANSNVWDSQSTNELQTKTINLECSANVTVDLWVF
jgi:hypothetical protein